MSSVHPLGLPTHRIHRLTQFVSNKKLLNPFCPLLSDKRELAKSNIIIIASSIKPLFQSKPCTASIAACFCYLLKWSIVLLVPFRDPEVHRPEPSAQTFSPSCAPSSSLTRGSPNLVTFSRFWPIAYQKGESCTRTPLRIIRLWAKPTVALIQSVIGLPPAANCSLASSSSFAPVRLATLQTNQTHSLADHLDW